MNLTEQCHRYVLSKTKEQLKMKGNRLTAVTTHKHRGIVFNRSLTWFDQISTVRTKCARRIGILPKMSHLFNKKIKKKLSDNSPPKHEAWLCCLERRQYNRPKGNSR